MTSSTPAGTNRICAPEGGGVVACGTEREIAEDGALADWIAARA